MKARMTRKISADQIIQAAMSFDMKKILERYCKDYDIPADMALEYEKELKRYLVLCASNPNINYIMKGPVDKLWHTFIIFTHEYADFCNQVAGHFIHHVPSAGQEKQSKPKKPDRFVEDYRKLFHKSPPRRAWPSRVNLLWGGMDDTEPDDGPYCRGTWDSATWCGSGMCGGGGG
jgi:hypothetical protein